MYWVHFTNNELSGRHSIYYAGSYISYQVERTIFRAEEATLRQFQGLAEVLDREDAGKISDKIIMLDGVNETEMVATMDLLEARWFQGPPPFSLDQWKAVLFVTTMWKFSILRDLAIRSIEDMKPPPLDTILLARGYNVPRLLSMAYTDLCMRTTPITAEEGEILGYRSFADLVRIRESRKNSQCIQCQNWTVSITCNSCVVSTRELVVDAVQKLLSDSTQT
ncbi:hypothetical protein FRC02_012339 [Tulasnella sp. 418]|nr:hypothetical protein FRC02_012339 [Tulasnella sp. 418]